LAQVCVSELPRTDQERTRMSSERYYRTVNEVKEVFSASEANELLKQGWELLKITEVQRDEVAKLNAGAEAVARVTLLVYLMGKGKQGSVQGPSKPGDLRPCNRCGKPIRFERNKDGKWGPVDEGGTPHRCS
jgi:hypothetical protein